MIWLEKKTDKGVLKYRMPNISEGYFYLSLADDTSTHSGILLTKSRIVSAMGSLIDHESVGLSSYEDLLSDKESFWNPISEISSEVLFDLNKALLKKT